MEESDDIFRARVRAHAVHERLENFEGLVRAQREWVEVLGVFAEAPTRKEAQRQLVSTLGFSKYQAMAIDVAMHFRELVGDKRQLFAERLDEARREADAASAD